MKVITHYLENTILISSLVVVESYGRQETARWVKMGGALPFNKATSYTEF